MRMHETLSSPLLTLVTPPTKPWCKKSECNVTQTEFNKIKLTKSKLKHKHEFMEKIGTTI